MSGAGGSASSAVVAVMQADRAAGVCKGVGLFYSGWLTSARRGHWARIYPPVSPSHKGAQSMLGLCGAVDAIGVRWGPRRVGQGQKIVAGSHNIRTEEGKEKKTKQKNNPSPQVCAVLVSFGLHGLRVILATSHSICRAFVIKCDS